MPQKAFRKCCYASIALEGTINLIHEGFVWELLLDHQMTANQKYSRGRIMSQSHWSDNIDLPNRRGFWIVLFTRASL